MSSSAPSESAYVPAVHGSAASAARRKTSASPRPVRSGVEPPPRGLAAAGIIDEMRRLPVGVLSSARGSRATQVAVHSRQGGGYAGDLGHRTGLGYHRGAGRHGPRFHLLRL